MIENTVMSLRALVFEWFENHPDEVFKRSCAKLYKAFNPRDFKESQTLRDYKREYRNQLLEKRGGIQKKPKRKKKHPEFIELSKEQWQEFKEFVGYIDEKGGIHEGESVPEPIDVDTGEFKGILWYQEEGFRIIETNDNILILWPRGHGKTWLLAWYIEWNMKHSVYKAMYLSITDVINDVADWVYEWAFANNLLAEGDNVDKTIRRSTPKNFRLTNNSKFKIFSIMDKKIRGKHDYTIFLDDIIEEGSLTHPSYQRMLERRWNSTISKMRRQKLVIVNTRVYEGDFIEYLVKQFENKQKIMTQKKPEDKYKWNLYIDLRTPFLPAPPNELSDEEGYWIDEKGERLLLAPELYTPEHFEAMEADDYESFMAEMMQNPTSIRGGMLNPEDLEYCKRPFFDQDVVMMGIGVDFSWEDESETSDFSAVVSCVMHGETIDKKRYKRFTVIKEDVERMPLYDIDEKKGIFTTIETHAKFLLHYYPNIPLIIAMERNSGGIIIIKVAQRERFWWLKHCISDKAVAVKWEKDGSSNVPLGINHKKNKIARVFGELQHSIKSREMKFDWIIEASLLEAQLLAFPRGKHDDGPDALGMIKDELQRRWSNRMERTPHEDTKLTRLKEQCKKQFEQMSQPWVKVRNDAIKNAQRKERFKKRPPF